MAVDIDGVNSTISTDKLIPQSGTALQIGESSDVITIPSGATITNSGTATGFGGGAWTFLSSATASASSSIDFTSSVITSTYDQYAVTMTNIKPATDSVVLWLRFSVSGSFITATDYPEAFMAINNAAGSAANNAGWANSASAKISMNSNASSNKLGTATNEQYNGTVFIYNPSDASHFTTCRGHCVYETDGGLFTTGSMGGHYIQTSAVDGIRFLMSSGNIASGVFRVYGIANS